MVSVTVDGYLLGEMLRVSPVIDFKLTGLRLILLFAGLFFTASICICSKWRYVVWIGFFLLFGVIALSVISMPGWIYPLIPARDFKWHILCAVPLASFMCSVVFGAWRRMTRAHWVGVVAFGISPYVYAFGTNTNMWQLGGCAGIFWILSGLMFLCASKHNRYLLPICAATQLVTILIVGTGLEQPFGQPVPIRQQSYSVDIGGEGKTLIVNEGFARSIKECVSAAQAAGFPRGTPVMDLTSTSEALIYAMGGAHLGGPAFGGGWRGSDAGAVATLRRVSCEQLAAAWLLVGERNYKPGGEEHITLDILSEFGANFQTDYELAGTFKAAYGVEGSGRMRQLFKPVRSVDDAIKRCAEVRCLRQKTADLE